MKKFLESLISRKQKAIESMRQRVKDSTDIDEVRSLGEQIEAAQAEIEEARAKLAECNSRLGGVRAGMDDEEGQEDEGEDEGEEEEQPDNNARSRNFAPGRAVASFDTRSNAPQQARALEARAKAFAKTGRQAVPVTEARAVLVSGGKIATPTEVSGINDAFTEVSSIVDMVKVVDCQGMGANKVAYMKASATGATKTEGAAITETDMDMGFVTITPQTEAVMSTISKEVRKQSPLNYAQKVRESALTALRKRAALLVTGKIKASALNEKITGITAIGADTLRKIVLNYGGSEEVAGGAVLFLNKKDLIAFGDVRGTNEKKAVYEITPDTGNPNTGIIKDGGLSVRYCINSNCTALTGATASASADTVTMLYGNPHCCELDLFSDYEIAVSEDRNIEKLMLTIVGDVQLGADVVVDKGFVTVVLPKTGS